MSTTLRTGAPAAPAPPPPQRSGPAPTWPHRALYDRVLAALHALPSRFESPLAIEGVPATDLFTMNTPLGAAIETSVVDSLNGLRQMWDPAGAYASYTFVRQSQTFPDVLLKSTDPAVADPILMGIELKGWFAIAKEGEPSFRYVAGVNVCAPADLLVVVPWLFDSVISGKPKLLQPIVVEARYAAAMRNYHWEYVRSSQSTAANRGVTLATHTGTYPAKSQHYSDRAISDAGGNFGRIARYGVITAEVEAVLKEDALGIPIFAWQRFLSVFSEKTTHQEIHRKLDVIESQFLNRIALDPQRREEVLERLRQILKLLQGQGAGAD
jgi:hypothetical protein